jgi:uncharacterized membrane protein HdeD (DUF308 family)
MDDQDREAGERVREVVSDVKEGVEEGVDAVTHGVKEGVDRVQDAVENVKHGVQDRVEDLKEAVDSKVGELWWGLLVRGLIIGALGLYLIFSPSSGLGLLARVIGFFLIADGAVALFSALSATDRGEFLWQGFVDLGLGLVLLLQPDFTDGAVMLVLGAWALFTGGSLIWKSRKLGRLDRVHGAMQAAGVVLAVVGLVFVFLPAVGKVGLAWLIGTGALIAAAALLFLARKMKGARIALDV